MVPLQCPHQLSPPPPGHRSVVMWELLTWELPWSAANPWQLVTHVTGGGRLDIPPRHQLPGADTAAFAALDGYVALLQRCWAQAPADRPGFEAIIPQLRWVVSAQPQACMQCIRGACRA